MLSFFKKKVRIGLDIGSHALKVCSLEGSATTCAVWTEALLPTRQGKDDSLSPDALKQRLTEMLKTAQTHCSPWSHQVDVSIDDPGAMSGFLSLPGNLNASQLQLAIPSALARELPYNLNEVEIFTTQVPPLTAGEQTIGLFYEAIPKKGIETRRALVTSLGYEVRQSQPALTALLLGIKRVQPLADKEVVAVIDSGFRQTTVVVTVGGYPYSAREFRLAGADFTYAFQMGEQIPWSEGEERKLAYDTQDREYFVEPFVIRWLGEVKRSVDYTSQALPGLKPSRIIFTGGTSRWKGLDRRLEEALSLPVACLTWQKIRPTATPTEKVDADVALYNIALGLVSS